MKIKKENSNPEFETNLQGSDYNLPLYLPEMGNESGINYRGVEIKSHSFSVKAPHLLAGENIIFEPYHIGRFEQEEE